MPNEISKITLPSGTTYDIKDKTARDGVEALKGPISGGVHYIGTTTTTLTDGATTNPITIGGKSVTAASGDLAIYGSKEFIFNGTTWAEFGDMGSLKALAFKDNASGEFTPAGSVSQPTFTGTSFASTGKFTPAGTISTGTGTANYTPAGGVSQPTFTGTSFSSSGKFTPSGSIGTGTGTANYTPAGSLSGGAITVTPSTVTKYVATSASAGGSATPGSAASWSANVANETLSFSWTANTPTAVTMPSFGSQTIATGISSASISTQPTFTGTGVQLKFTGSEGNVSVSGTATGTVSKPTFTGTGVELKFGGTEGDVSVSGTATGTVSKPTFTGTKGTVTVS